MPATDQPGTLLPCPCCGAPELGAAGDYEIRGGGANADSLNQARRKWLAGQIDIWQRPLSLP